MVAIILVFLIKKTLTKFLHDVFHILLLKLDTLGRDRYIKMLQYCYKLCISAGVFEQLLQL